VDVLVQDPEIWAELSPQTEHEGSCRKRRSDSRGEPRQARPRLASPPLRDEQDGRRGEQHETEVALEQQADT
jgi:hypothetical protein